MMAYNYSSPVPTYNCSEPQPVPINPILIFDPTETPYPEEPPMTSPMEPTYVDPIYSAPPMDAPEPPSVSIKTFLAVVQPLLDMIATLLPPGDSNWYPGAADLPSQTTPVKRVVAADQVGEVTEREKPFFADLIKSLVISIQCLLETTPVGSIVDQTSAGNLTNTAAPITETLGGVTAAAPVTETLGGSLAQRYASVRVYPTLRTSSSHSSPLSRVSSTLLLPERWLTKPP
jgi:hypothetical protein